MVRAGAVVRSDPRFLAASSSCRGTLSPYGARADNQGMDAPRGSVELEVAELERLRRRAYGPDADIAGDAVAQARLSELEVAQRRQQTPVRDATAWASAPVPERVPVAAPVEGPRSASTSVPRPVDEAFSEHEADGGSDRPADGPIADSDPINGAPAAPWWRRPRWLAILGGAIAVLAVIAAYVVGISQPLPDEPPPIPTDTSAMKLPPNLPGLGHPDYLPTPDVVLALKSVGEDEPQDVHRILDALGISADELWRYEDYEDFVLRNVWAGESRYGMTCLFVTVPGGGLREGESAQGCSPKGLDAMVDLGPMGLDGITRFVLKGDHVNVYEYERAADPNASQD